MATEWDGKSRGSVFGFKVFVFFIKHFGVKSAYTLMHLPVPYFCLFSGKNVQGLRFYFRRRLCYSWFKSAISIYKTYYTFGQTLIDKIAISGKLSKNYTFTYNGEQHIKQALAENNGGLLISAHMGNFELAQYFFKNRIDQTKVSIVITDQDHQAIKDYLSQYLNKDETQFIIVKNDFSHIFEINSALANNRLVCISGDRYLEGVKCIEGNLLGKKAKFPVGPFHLGSKLQVPVLFVYVFREPKKQYQLYAERVEITSKNPEYLLRSYTQSLEKMIAKYPLQWFNFYNFWDDEA
jgi:predicted LPLAT superfamily acyltransferase